MIIKSLKILFTAILIALPLLLLSYAISYFIKDSTKSDLILFLVGAILIVSFGPGIFTRSTSGALHTPKVIWRLVGSSNQNEDGSHSGALLPTPQIIYRLVGSSNQNKNESQNGVDQKTSFAASLSLVLSGVILWAVSFFV
jgi:hypothetical protein